MSDGAASPGRSAPAARRVALATTAGALPLARAAAVARDLAAAWPELKVEVRVVATSGTDAALPGSESAVGGAARALRDAVRERAADVAVHDVADLPPGADDGVCIGAVPLRADPRDVLVSRSGKVLAYLPSGTRIGAGTPGRAAQLLRRRRDLVVVPVSGDVVARLDRLRSGDCDAVILSAAALARLDRLERVTEYFDTDQLIPAPGQGTIALEHRQGDDAVAALLAPLHDAPSAWAATAERTCLAHLRAPRDAAIGVFAVTDTTTAFVHGIVATADGTRAARLRWTGPWRPAEDAGETLAELLLGAGAHEILSGVAIPPTVDFAAEHRRRIQETWGAPYPPEEA